MTANTNKPETPKSFADLVKANPDSFEDDFDAGRARRQRRKRIPRRSLRNG
jgi:hypothetical protein